MAGRDDLLPLTYAGPLAQYGVVVLPDGENLRIILPPTPTGQRIVLGVGAFFLAWNLIGLIMSHDRPSWVGTVSSLAFWMVILGACFRRLGRPSIVQITPKTFRVDTPASWMGAAQHPPIQQMPTATIYRVYYDVGNRALFIRGHRQEMIECPCHYGGPAGEELAMIIRRHLHLPDDNPNPGAVEQAAHLNSPKYEEIQ